MEVPDRGEAVQASLAVFAHRPIAKEIPIKSFEVDLLAEKQLLLARLLCGVIGVTSSGRLLGETSGNFASRRGAPRRQIVLDNVG